MKRLFCGLITSLEDLAPRFSVLAAAQAALETERRVDVFTAAIDAEQSEGK